MKEVTFDMSLEEREGFNGVGLEAEERTGE